MLDLKALLAKILNCLTCDLLYDGSFTSGALTLTNAIANYKSLIFVYTDNDGVLHTQQVITNNVSGGDFILDVVRVTGAPYLKNMIFNINGNVLTLQFNRQWAGTTPTTGNYVILNKVYGCKGIVANGGGYLTSKFYSIFSHLERWWEYVRLKSFIDENVARKTNLIRPLHHSVKNVCGKFDDMVVCAQSEYPATRGVYTSRDSRSITISPIIARVRSDYSLPIIRSQNCWVYKKHIKFGIDRLDNLIAIVCEKCPLGDITTERGCLPC